MKYIYIYILSAAVSNDPQIFCRTTAVAAKPIHQQVREFAIKATALVKTILNIDGQRHVQITNVGANRMLSYGHLRRLPHPKLAPVLSLEVDDALDLAMIQMDKVLSKAQKTSYANQTLCKSMDLVTFAVVPLCLGLLNFSRPRMIAK